MVSLRFQPATTCWDPHYLKLELEVTDMKYTTLGSTGTKVSQRCLGTWRFAKETDGVVEIDRKDSYDLLDTAWEHAINFIDTANVYGSPPGESERYIDEWLENYDRDKIVITSKVYSEMDSTHPNGQGISRSISVTRSMGRLTDSAPTTSTSIIFTAGTKVRRSARR